ncbi:MAG: GNAT family N-acetyltransferase [Microthrixaceae bacterium]
MADDTTDPTPEVVHVPDQRRFELLLGAERVGLAEYVRRGGRYVFVHTEVDPRLEGRGLGTVLIRTALDTARAEQAEVVPLCPFVAAFIERHPDYRDLVDEEALRFLDR